MVRPFRVAVAAAQRQGQLYFAALLPEDRILEAFGAARATWQGWVYTPAITRGCPGCQGRHRLHASSHARVCGTPRDLPASLPCPSIRQCCGELPRARCFAPVPVRQASSNWPAGLSGIRGDGVARPPPVLVWAPGPSGAFRQTGRMMRKDCQAAHLPYVDVDGVAGFHSHRVAFISNLSRTADHRLKSGSLAGMVAPTFLRNKPIKSGGWGVGRGNTPGGLEHGKHGRFGHYDNPVPLPGTWTETAWTLDTCSGLRGRQHAS